MSDVEAKLLEKLEQLPPEKLVEVEDFVDFLASKLRREPAFDRLFAIAPALEAAGVKPMSNKQVAAMVKQVRTARRARRREKSRSASRP